ncbi:peptidylprolyl isomerase [candidate division KSB1 bacterium]|nr:peptidylprolyl isomerase [candidate division KSB1 bacterium]MBL7093734.1 peptidylprolyl isomerase [candidate division KSB1 bacterium]
MKAPSPDIYKILFETNEGNFIVEVHRDWSPNGADHLYHLVNYQFYDGVRFFRVIKGFMAQFGYHGDPKIGNVWKSKNIPDDPVKESNLRGYITFAKSGMPNSRSTNLFINYADNSNLDGMGFSPIGKVIEGMEVVDKIYGGYGEGAPRGKGPSQGKIMEGGNTYLKKNFPELDYIKKARIVN